MHSAKKQKVASFYSKSLPRPTVLLDNDDKPVRDRVDAPEPVTGALLEWAKHAPMNKGGIKPVQDKRKELLAGEMLDYYRAEPKSLQADAKAAAVKQWKLLDEEHRSAYQERAAADQLRWEKEVEQYEHKFPHYRSHLAQKHVKKLNDKGIIDIQLSQLGIKKPFTARHYYIKEEVEKRVTEADSLTGDMADLFEEISNAKRKAWQDMADSGKTKYEKLAEEDKQRFEDQLQAHPKLATMIAAYEEKQQELQTLKKSKSKKISRGSKKRRRPEEKEASDDDEGAQEMEVDKAAGTTEQGGPLAESAQTHVPEDTSEAAAEGDAAQQAPEADEQVSDTDDDDEDDADFGGDLLETVQETQNDEEEQALTGSQASTLKQRLGMQKFGSFIAGLFTNRKPGSRPLGKEPTSQPGQSAAANASAAAVPEADVEGDDMPPIQNTLESQPSVAALKEKSSSPTLTPAGPSATSQLPQQSLVDKLNEVAEEAPVLPAAVGTADASIAFVTTPGLAKGIQTTADAAGEAGPEDKAGAAETAPPADQGTIKATDESLVETSKEQLPVSKRANRAAKVAASDKIFSSATLGSGGKRVSSASRPSAEENKVAGETAADGNKENNGSAPPTVGGQEASHMAEKEPHSRVDEAQASRKKKAGKDARNPMIGRCVKKDFETEKGLNTYTGWIIGKHASKPWYAVQYEDGDKEELVISELKKRNILQPAGVEQRTDFEELERLYAEAQVEWAADEAEEGD